MAMSEALKRAQAKYKKNKVRQVQVAFFPTEIEVWKHLNNQPNKAGYIKGLIRKDMQK